MSASRDLPLFPLPGVVLLPETLLPLHIFEDRYRAMVADALRGDRTIGMALLRPGGERAAEERIYAIGGAGEIVESEELEDGRYNILLQARFRFRVLGESAAGSYRVARVEEVPSVPFGSAGEQARAAGRSRALFRSLEGGLELPALPSESLSAERLASEIALRLRYSPPELQSILETDAVQARFETLDRRMIEWKARLEFLAPFRPANLDSRTN
jgi:Lon protease-like protein